MRLPRRVRKNKGRQSPSSRFLDRRILAALRTTPPGRRLRVLQAGGDSNLTPSADVDLVDPGDGSFVHRVGDLLAIRRVGRLVVARSAVGKSDLTPTTGVDGVGLVGMYQPGWCGAYMLRLSTA
jgi:hypothetical protein